MLIMLAWVAMLVWHWHMARRARAKKLVPDVERQLAIRLNHGVRVATMWVLGLWLLAFVVHVRAASAMEAADYAVGQCKGWMHDKPLQACMAPAQAVYVDTAGTAATSDVFVWVLGVL